MEIKICGLTDVAQAVAVAQLGVTAVGIVCVPTSPRYVPPTQQRAINHALSPYRVWRVGVFANTSLAELVRCVQTAGFDTVQLHGEESPAFCQALRQTLPHLRLVKAIRVRDGSSLAQLGDYQPWVDRLLLDAYHPQQLGGTGKSWDWHLVAALPPGLPWWLAGGLTPENCRHALAQTQPQGIDVSSGVEVRPGWKDLSRVKQLVTQVATYTCQSIP